MNKDKKLYLICSLAILSCMFSLCTCSNGSNVQAVDKKKKSVGMPMKKKFLNISKIKPEAVELLDKDVLLFIYYSNVIYEFNGKKVKIPIYGGKYGDVEFKDLMDYCYKKKYLDKNVQGFLIALKIEKGKVRNTFHDFLDFYKSKNLEGFDVTKPTKMDYDGCEWWIYYDFIQNGVPCFFEIRVHASKYDLEKYKTYKTPYEIRPEEKSFQGSFSFYITVGKKYSDVYPVKNY